MSRAFFETRERVAKFEAIEVYHPAVGVIRYVNKQFYDKEFKLESGAPRNAGETVTFTAGNFQVQHPDVSEDGVMSMTVQLGRIGTDIKSKLKAIKDYNLNFANTLQTEYIYREFINGVPSTFSAWISNITISGDSVAITASDDNPALISVATRYSSQKFPGMKVII